MSAQFWPCPGCSRHIKRGDAFCPFCGATASVDTGPTRVLAGRLSRAALFAVGAVGTAVATTDCGGLAVSEYGGSPIPIETEDASVSDSPSGIAADAGVSSATDVFVTTPPYGQGPVVANPAVDADAVDASGATMSSDSASAADVPISSTIAPYGSPVFGSPVIPDE
jgi:hypothetical protein